MPVPSSIDQLSQTPGMNFPSGSESPSLLDNYDRQYAAFIAMLRDGQGFSTPLDLASAATTDIGTQPSMFLRITGTTTITSFGTNYNGPRFLVFSGALTLTHNATSLILQGSANILTAPGDCAIAVPNASTPTGWRVITYQRAEGFSAQPSAVWPFARSTAPAGWLKANGAAVAISAYPDLAAALYVGDVANATALFGYRCTDPGNPSTSRNIAGTHIVLPDLRGEFIRGWDDGRGVDTGRAHGTAQASDNLSHTHTGSANSAGAHAHTYQGAYTQVGLGYNTGGGAAQVTGATTSTDGNHGHTLTVNASGGTEARPRNVSLLYCIKY